MYEIVNIEKTKINHEPWREHFDISKMPLRSLEISQGIWIDKPGDEKAVNYLRVNLHREGKKLGIKLSVRHKDGRVLICRVK